MLKVCYYVIIMLQHILKYVPFRTYLEIRTLQNISSWNIPKANAYYHLCRYNCVSYYSNNEINIFNRLLKYPLYTSRSPIIVFYYHFYTYHLLQMR